MLFPGTTQGYQSIYPFVNQITLVSSYLAVVTEKVFPWLHQLLLSQFLQPSLFLQLTQLLQSLLLSPKLLGFSLSDLSLSLFFLQSSHNGQLFFSKYSFLLDDQVLLEVHLFELLGLIEHLESLQLATRCVRRLG